MKIFIQIIEFIKKLSTIKEYLTNITPTKRAIASSMLFLAIFALSFFYFHKGDNNQGYYGIKSAPSWLDKIDYSDYELKTDKEKHSNGAVTLLSETQVNFIDEVTYFRNVKKIISFQGVNKHGVFFQEYEPYYSKIYLSQVFVIRNGKKIDKTKDIIVKIRDKKIEDGNSSFSEFKKISFIIPRVKKDDIIDYSVLRYENNCKTSNLI